MVDRGSLQSRIGTRNYWVEMKTPCSGQVVNNTNLHIYQSNFRHESRMLKETKSLAHSGLVDRIYIAAIWESGTKEHEQLASKREVWRVPLKTRLLPNGSVCRVLKYTECFISPKLPDGGANLEAFRLQMNGQSVSQGTKQLQKSLPARSTRAFFL